MLGRAISRTLPLGQSESFIYDQAGQRTAHTDFKGQTVAFAHDELSRPIRSEYPNDVVVETRYTPSGQVWEIEVTCTPAACAEAGKDPGITRHHYDVRDRLTRIEYPDGRWIEYEYDAAGNRTEVRTQNQRTRYTYDALNRMHTVTACGNEDCSVGETTTYHYNAVGSRSGVEHANGTATEYQYDELNRLTLLRTWNAQGSLIQRQQFHLGAAGHREMVVEVPERVVEYTYDALYRLTEEKVTDPNGDRTTTYTFDATGNRLSRAVSCDPACTGEVEAGTTTYVYDANDRLLEETGPDGATVYTYDENGNTTQKTAPDGIVDYHYNADDRLTRATGDLESAATEASYTYDAHGIRQGQVVDGVVGRFLVDPNHEYAQVVEELDGAGNPTTLYVIGHERISQKRAEGYFTYHGDGLGSIRILTDVTGTATDSYVYEAYGLLEHREGSTPNNFRYTGEQYDPNLGFYYLRARYYNPATGRFPTMDTYQGRIHEPQTLHKYLYVHADPVNNTDPSGHMTLGQITAGLNVMATIASRAIAIYQVYDKIDMTLSVVQGMMKVRSVISSTAGSAIVQGASDDEGFVNLMKNLDSAIAVLARNAPRIIIEINKHKREVVRQFIQNRRNDLIIYGPTPSSNTPWFPSGTRVPFGSISLSGGKRRVLVELGASKRHRGRVVGLGHSQGSGSGHQQWFRMDWHETHGPGTFDWEDPPYHFHVRK